jgi:hypothetical protein
MSRVRTAALWVSIVWVGVLLVWLPEVRLSTRAYVGCVWVVIVWFFLARTKSLTWSAYMRFFAACIPWSVAIGVVSGLLAVSKGLAVDSAGPSMAIAGLTEECLKLLPLALVAAAAPRRAARFATVDWLLLGMASGTAFTLVEEMLRRLSFTTTTPGILDRIIPVTTVDGLPTSFVSFGVGVLPTSFAYKEAVYAGHGAITALVAGCVGVGIAMWRSASRPTSGQRRSRRVAAVALPTVALWIAVTDHVGRNAQAHSGRLLNIGVPDWLDPSVSTVPWWMRAPWSLLGHGHGRVWLLGLVLAAALLVDGYRLVLRPASNLASGSPPRWVFAIPRSVGSLTRRWPPVIARLLVTGTLSLTGLIWIVVRDVGQVIAAHSRVDGEPRTAAVRRGFTAASGQRLARELTCDAALSTAHPRRVRTVAATCGIGLLALALIVAPAVAANIGANTWHGGLWLAGKLDGLGDWWTGLGPTQQIGVAIAVAALIALSGGSLGVAFGISGVATYGIAHAHGAATFTRDPVSATRSYLTTTTPAGALLDAAEFALTFAPGNFAGAAAGRGIRLAADELARDPAAFIAARRLAMDDRGVLDMGAFLRREPVLLGDGSVQPALSAADEAAAVARYEAHRQVPTKGMAGPARDGQIEVYGHNERAITLGDGKEVHPDGFTSIYGAVGDYKHVTADASSWYVPSTLDDRIRDVAVAKMDTQLRRLQQAADVVAQDGRGIVEITTNSPSAAQYIEGRMSAAGIRGYVRLVGRTF